MLPVSGILEYVAFLHDQHHDSALVIPKDSPPPCCHLIQCFTPFIAEPYSVVQLCSICLSTYRLMAVQTDLPFVAKHLRRVEIVLVRLGKQKAIPVGERCAGLKQVPITMSYTAVLICPLGPLPFRGDSSLCFLALAIPWIVVCALGDFAERSVAPTWNIRGIRVGRAESCPQL